MKHNKIENSHGSYKSYVIGFALSIILTLLAYFSVTMQLFSRENLYYTVMLLAVAQFLVQVVFFLHITTETGPKWNLTSFIFTLIMVFILVGGSLWVMHNMNANMM